MTCYSIDLKTRKYVEGCWLLSLARNLSNKYKKKILNAATKVGLDTVIKQLKQ